MAGDILIISGFALVKRDIMKDSSFMEVISYQYKAKSLNYDSVQLIMPEIKHTLPIYYAN
jgi:hypothetical protein